MSGLARTISRLSALRALRGNNAIDLGGEDHLSDLVAFGSNPGALRARTYVPRGLSEGAPLVVVLHGCTQNAAAYDRGAGWSRLADRAGFALLFPEQQRANNPHLCFNWFEPGDIRRDAGEILSIRQMIAKFVADHALDRRRIFVTGLSAGGAMACALLATSPDLFAGGAIIAGLPYGSAASIPEAFERMRGQGMPSPRELEARVRNAAPRGARWPTLSIWHGSADAVVHPSNVDAILDQWRGLHGLDAAPTRTDVVDSYPRRVWCGDDGRVRIEEIIVSGMGHGTPIDASGGDAAAGAFMLDAGISSTEHIARFWGLLPMATATATATAKPDRAASAARPRLAVAARVAPPAAGGEVGQVIERALRAAGLMR
ncbi:MAG: esterase, depolymerase family protein [Rhodospirillales bacterium]|nr:esterase, depolymerase family protein [Rhodospirillales bacterium]